MLHILQQLLSTEKSSFIEEENKEELKINESRILLYQSNDGTIKIDVRFEDELKESVVVRKFLITTQHGAIAEKTQDFF
ncbi:MAG: hypothetical protein LBK58_10395 [Prevotellaceae bacterium]|nr:hypothetical protein [Prevotellaceae bacterium]